MANYKSIGSIKVSEDLYQFINEEALEDAELDVEQFWSGFEKIVTDFSPRNKELLKTREKMQEQITDWHEKHSTIDAETYRKFLEDIGYIEPVTDDFTINVDKVDDEISQIAGPQLVVPINNPRYSINAANSRWGSLYDAFYGTDIISEENGQEKGTSYNPVRGKQVIQKSKAFLDETTPLATGSYQDITKIEVRDDSVVFGLSNGSSTTLKNKQQFKGYQGEKNKPTSILLENNGFHMDIQIDKNHPIGKTDPAHIKDVAVESAITSIMDCEDSIAAVDAEDKVDVYRNWKGLIRGELTTSFQKGDETVHRTFNEDREYKTTNGDTLTLSGRVLMLVRNVGHLMTNNAVLLPDGSEVYEGILDGICTSLIAKHNLLGKGKHINSKEGSIYIVKPKMHGSEEVAFTNDLFAAIEEVLHLERNTLKMGIMDEERRTSLNLKNCISQAKERAIFINTGWLDRTGDEIHTSMSGGAFERTADMKGMDWFQSYEKNNVEQGLNTGFQQEAQIGKGMWPKPDEMLEMSKEKINHVLAGANTAWVPSPTAATVHALHYHEEDVKKVQDKLIEAGTTHDYSSDILQIPFAVDQNWSEKEKTADIGNH